MKIYKLEGYGEECPLVWSLIEREGHACPLNGVPFNAPYQMGAGKWGNNGARVVFSPALEALRPELPPVCWPKWSDYWVGEFLQVPEELRDLCLKAQKAGMDHSNLLLPPGDPRRRRQYADAPPYSEEAERLAAEYRVLHAQWRTRVEEYESARIAYQAALSACFVERPVLDVGFEERPVVGFGRRTERGIQAVRRHAAVVARHRGDVVLTPPKGQPGVLALCTDGALVRGEGRVLAVALPSPEKEEQLWHLMPGAVLSVGRRRYLATEEGLMTQPEGEKK